MNEDNFGWEFIELVKLSGPCTVSLHSLSLSLSLFTNWMNNFISFIRLWNCEMSSPTTVFICSSFVQFKPQCRQRQYVHCDDNASHEINVVVRIEFADAHFAQKYFRFTEVAITELSMRRTPQVSSIHSVYSIKDTMETCSEIWNVPHPLEHFIDINVTRTKSEHWKQHRQYWTDENGNLKTTKQKQTIENDWLSVYLILVNVLSR